MNGPGRHASSGRPLRSDRLRVGSATGWLAEDRGGVSLLAVVVAAGLLCAIGLVVDGGGRARAAASVDDAARAAARAAVQAIDTTAVMAGGAPVADPLRAAAAARTYLATAGVAGTVRVEPGGRVISVRTTGSYEPRFLVALGSSRLEVSGQATAELFLVREGVAQ